MCSRNVLYVLYVASLCNKTGPKKIGWQIVSRVADVRKPNKFFLKFCSKKTVNFSALAVETGFIHFLMWTFGKVSCCQNLCNIDIFYACLFEVDSDINYLVVDLLRYARHDEVVTADVQKDDIWFHLLNCLKFRLAMEVNITMSVNKVGTKTALSKSVDETWNP